MRVDQPTGTSLTVEPPLPSSIHISVSAIYGNTTTPLNGTYTVTATNAEGSVQKLLRIRTETCRSVFYHVRFLVGEGHAALYLNDSVLFDNDVDPSTIVPVCTDGGNLTVVETCSTPTGCWLSVHRLHERLPPSFAGFQETWTQTVLLPFTAFSVRPFQTDYVIMEGEPLSILWRQVGFFASVTLHQLPSWIAYDPLDHCLVVEAGEVGNFTGFVEVTSTDGSAQLPVSLTVLPEEEVELQGLQSLAFVFVNDRLAPAMTLLKANGGNITWDLIFLDDISTHRVVQTLLVPQTLRLDIPYAVLVFSPLALAQTSSYTAPALCWPTNRTIRCTLRQLPSSTRRVRDSSSPSTSRRPIGRFHSTTTECGSP